MNGRREGSAVSLTLEQIPDADVVSPGAALTTMLTDLKATRTRRRTVLRGVALDWSGLFGGRAARAETGPGGLWGWDRNDCADAYPSGENAGFERDLLGAEIDQQRGAWAKVHEVFYGFLGSMNAARFEAV